MSTSTVALTKRSWLLSIILTFSAGGLIYYRVSSQKVRFVANDADNNAHLETANWTRGLKSTTTSASTTVSSTLRRKPVDSQLLRKEWLAPSRRTTETFVQTNTPPITGMANTHSRSFLKGEAKAVERNQESDSEAFKREMTRCSIAMGVAENSLKEHSMDINTISKNASTFLNAIWSIVPRNFSENYRNPCWHSSDIRISKAAHGYMLRYKSRMKLTQNKTLLCLPNFFIAGFPKSGTTTLHEALHHHTQIAPIQSKEPHWWTRTPLHDLDHNHLQRVVLQYLFRYSYAAKKINVLKNCITYDGSQSTLWDSNFNRQDYCAMPAVISQVLPEAKFIVVMRNPITRLYSNYLFWYTLRLGMNISKWPEEVRMDPAGNFHNNVVSVIQHFNGCLLNHSLYECANENGNLEDRYLFAGMRHKLTVSIYYVHLLKWFQFYSKEQFLFLRTDDMVTDPPEFLSRITNFLGLHPVSPQQARQWFKKKKNVQTFIFENPSKFVMRNETWRLLEDFYKPYNAMLADLASDERFLWNDN